MREDILNILNERFTKTLNANCKNGYHTFKTNFIKNVNYVDICTHCGSTIFGFDQVIDLTDLP